MIFRSSIALVATILLQGSPGYSKCIDFDEGAPNFCATLKLLKLVRNGPNECYYDAEITNLRPTPPQSKPYEHYAKKFADDKNQLVLLQKADCETATANKTLDGVIVVKCFDNRGDEFFGLGNFVRGLFGKETLYQKINFYHSVEIHFPKDGLIALTCEQQK